MSDINLDFTVSNNSIDFTVQPNDITITPEEIQLTFTSGSTSVPGGSNTQLQYNNNGILDGIPNVTYNGSNISLGNVSTVKITGGVNGYVLQTDGTGNLDWAVQSGGGGNGSPGGANTQIQYNDAGTFGGNVGFTFNEITGNVNVPSNLIAIGNITAPEFIGNATNSNFANFAGNVTLSAQPNITSLGNLTSIVVNGMTSIQEAKEKVNIVAAAANATLNLDMLDQAITYYTANSVNNFTINVRGNSTTTLNSIMNTGESMTLGLAITNGASGKYANVFQIDGFNRTPLYVGGAITTPGTNNGIDLYTYNLIKTGSNAWTVLGTRLGFS